MHAENVLSIVLLWLLCVIHERSIKINKITDAFKLAKTVL